MIFFTGVLIHIEYFRGESRPSVPLSPLPLLTSLSVVREANFFAALRAAGAGERCTPGRKRRKTQEVYRGSTGAGWVGARGPTKDYMIQSTQRETFLHTPKRSESSAESRVKSASFQNPTSLMKLQPTTRLLSDTETGRLAWRRRRTLGC